MNDADAPTLITQKPTRSVSAVMTEPPLGADNYQIGHEIARGGMGSILEAEDSKLKRTVAVKIMHLDASADVSMRQRFLREAEVLAMLAHPNIVPIHDIVWEDGLPLFYSMKMVKGRTLQDILTTLRHHEPKVLRDYTLDRLLLIFRKICDAIAFAHSKGVLHRDLKPENVMVGEFGEVLVMDWGLAKRQNDETRMTNAESSENSSFTAPKDSFTRTLDGAVMGTPQYMSPEQALGQIDELDARSDIFSLGGILYAILTLRPPVEGKTLEEVLKKVTSADITSPSALQSGSTEKGKSAQKGDVLEAKLIKPLPHTPSGRVPAALSSVVMKALRLDKARRYQSVAEFSADIEAYQSGFATKAEEAGLAKQLLLLIKRNKGIFTTAAAAWLLITALAVWFVINLRMKEQRALAGEAVAVAEKEAARQSLARSALNLAEAALREGNGPEMQTALNDVPEDLRDSTWNYLLGQSDTSIAQVRTSTTLIYSAVADPRRPGVFAVSDDRTIVTVLEVRTGVRLLEFKPDMKQGRRLLAFSPDGERIAIGLWDSTPQPGGGIVIHSARDGRKLQGWDAPKSERLEFSPDGQWLLQTTQGQNQIHVWDANDGRLAWSYPSAPTGAVTGVFTADGRQVVTTEVKEGLRLVNARDGVLVRALPRSRDNVRSLKTHADGTVTAGGDGGTIMRIRLSDGRVLADFRTGDTDDIKRLALTPDGSRIVTAAMLPDGRQHLRLWDARNGALVQSPLGGRGDLYGIEVHPQSGELLAFGSSSRVWSLTGTPERWILNGPHNTQLAFWGSDDTVIAPAIPGTIGLMKLQTGSAAILWKPNGFYRLASVSADGRLAALARRDNAEPIRLLRQPGPEVEQVATYKSKLAAEYLRLSPTGDRLVVVESERREVEWFDTATGQQPVALERKDVKRFLDFVWLDGQRLLGLVTAKADRGNPGSEEWIVIWDATTGKILQTVTNRTPLGVLALAPDGRRFAEAGADKKVRIRDTATLAVQQEFRAHDGPIAALAWHPTKPILATTSADLAIRLWNLDTGRRLEELRGPLGTPNSLVFSPGGQRLACSAADRITRIWEPPSLADKPATAPDPNGWDDLLAPLTPAAVVQTGSGWRLDNGALFSPARSHATLPLAGGFAGTSYTVRLKLRQLAPKDVIHVALPVADRMAGFEIDGFPSIGFYSGLIQVDGKFGPSLPGALHGKQVNDAEQHDLEITVRLADANVTITTTLDGQPFYEWTGLISALSQHDKWTTPPGSLALGTITADWVVYEVKVKRMKSGE